MTISFTVHAEATAVSLPIWIVHENGQAIGTLIVPREPGLDRNAWIAYVGTDMEAQMIGRFYDEDGGQDAAVAAIQARHREATAPNRSRYTVVGMFREGDPTPIVAWKVATSPAAAALVSSWHGADAVQILAVLPGWHADVLHA